MKSLLSKTGTRQAAVGLFPAVVFLAYLSATMVLFLAGPPAPTLAAPAVLIEAHADHLLLRWVPGLFRTGLLGVSSYLTEGYFALSPSAGSRFAAAATSDRDSCAGRNDGARSPEAEELRAPGEDVTSRRYLSDAYARRTDDDRHYDLLLVLAS